MTVTAGVPARAEGLELIGEMLGSGYRVPPSLVRRADGQTLQVTPLLYAMLASIDGQRTYAEVAQAVSLATGRSVASADVEQLVDSQLRPLGLVVRADGSEPELKRANPLLGLRFKIAATDPRRTRALTNPFVRLFHPLVWLSVLALFAGVSWWLLFDKGLASATYEAFQRPMLLLLVFVVTVLSAGFHELGHAAAARRGGATPGVMGAGLYLVWPAFYTDVTDSYRLGRLGRLRTDLGGLYFNAIVAVVITGAWLLSGWDALLLVVATQILQMVRQLAPFVRFDGYHVLADLTGVPDLYHRIGPTLASLWPPRGHDPRVGELKPWARVVITVWVLVVVPMLLLSLFTMILVLPRIAGTAWAGVHREWGEMSFAWGQGHVVEGLAGVLSVVAIGFPVLAIGVLLFRLGRTVLRASWTRTHGCPARRAGAMALVGLALAGLAYAWWPGPDRYRPVQPYERGVITQAVAAPLAAAGYAVPAARAPVASAPVQASVQTVLPDDIAMPTREHPQLSLVLVPHQDPGKAGLAAESGDVTAPTWVFPFDRPLPPGEGDNQAGSVNTTDGTATYDIAVAMVWVDDGDQVLNTNEAYAFASCKDCVAVAVAFQVVVVVGQSDVVVPQNLSEAANYNCFRCLTAAIASQLVVTVASAPGEEQQVALADLWGEIEDFAAQIPSMPLDEVIASLADYKTQILAILGAAPAAPSTAPSGPGLISASTSPSAGSTSSPTPDGVVSPSPTTAGSASGDSSPTSSPTTSSSSTPTPTGSSSASPTASTSTSP